MMKRVNKEGPAILGAGHHHEMLDKAKLLDAVSTGTVLDLRPSSEFAAKHVPGTINIPLGMLAGWAGWLVDYDRPVSLICDSSQLEEAARVLHKIGVETISGGFETESVLSSGMATESYASQTPKELAGLIEAGDVKLIDVRSDSEWNEGHIEQAEHRFLGRLPDQLGGLQKDEPVVVQCRSGARSAIAVSVLQAAGYRLAINLTGGYLAWSAEGLPTSKMSRPVAAM
ncbi:metallo-beta-lactamase/rhodanese-like domain-containing protein [Rhodopirellula sallentina SM41]|uniref:Metallo-beta-lactamase/rhodanese-like domain-containing protein n=1 Tax=Rhodopirellula sallentina SM41 TaxID=1263870 RepID=M5TSB6_9BACT|nr:metallo-beta-lactamase/rhodanese-like domain-containing protein [Rhodopirellula sallentina SM41]